MPRPTMTKSAIGLAKVALHAARRSLPKYSHPFSPKKFTVHQLLAILAIREFYHLDYRGVERMLQEWSDLRVALGLKEVPTYSTLCKAAMRLLKKNFERLLQHTVSTARQQGLISARPQLIGDSTGFEVGHTSFYFRSHRGKRKFYVPRWPKLTACVDMDSHLMISACVSVGPSRDTLEAPAVVRKAHRRVQFRRIIWDGGCDAENFHALVRTELKAHSLIPIKSGTRTRKWPPTKYRRQMKRRFFKRIYGQRWQIESVFSRHKRRLTSNVRAKTWSAQQSEVYMRIVVHNLMILRRPIRAFQQSKM